MDIMRLGPELFIMNDTHSNNSTKQESPQDFCLEPNYLPIPLKHVPANILEQIRIYIKNGDIYNLYNNTGLGFSWTDQKRLIDSNIQFVYILDKDFTHNGYMFRDIIEDICMDTSLPLRDRVRLLYENIVALAYKVSQLKLDSAIIQEIIKFCRKIVVLISNETHAMEYLIDAANHKDHEVSVHMANNAMFMMCFALKAGLTEKKTLATIGAGALLQDIGKNYLPEEILNKSTELEENERETLKEHVKLGIKKLSQIPDIDEEIMDIVAHHHERHDGSGYPNKLKGNKIPLMGQVAGLVDAFEAMISVRPYRPEPLTVQLAIIEIENSFKDKFDKDLITSFTSFVRYHLLGVKNITEQDLINFEIASLRVVDKAANPSGRRHEREYLRCSAKAKSLSYMKDQWVPDDIQLVTIYNISRSGVGFLSHMPFTENKLIQIIINSNGTVLPLLAKCVRSTQQNRDWHTIGVKFLRTFTRSEFRAMSEKLDFTPGDA